MPSLTDREQDLNYRINLPEDEVVVLTEPPIKPHNVAVLMEYDEVRILFDWNER